MMDFIIKNSQDEYLEKLYQYDKNQGISIILKPEDKFFVLESTGADIYVDFYNSKSEVATPVAGVVERNKITVMIPNEFLQESLNIGFMLYADKDGVCNTIAEGKIPVTERIAREVSDGL